jgi:hypothetical protein
MDVSGEIDLEAGRVKLPVFVDAALAAKDPPPQVFHLETEGRDGTNAGDNYTAFHGPS